MRGNFPHLAPLIGSLKASQIIDLRGESTPINVTNGPSIKMTPDDLLLYPQIGTSLSPHQQNVLHLAKSTETHIWSMCIECVQTMGCPAPNGTSIPRFSSQEERFFEGKGEERVEESVVVDELKETMISGHNTEVAQKTS